MALTRPSMDRSVGRLGIAWCQAGQRSMSLRPLPEPSLTCNGILGSATALPGLGAQGWVQGLQSGGSGSQVSGGGGGSRGG